jgi:hypothetical protein
MKKARTLKRAPRTDKIKTPKKVFFMFEARFTMTSGRTVEGWFYCAGPSWKPGEPCTGPFRTEREAARHADEFGGMVQ